MKIGFIGLGIMGESMCENIVKKHNDTVFACDHKQSQIDKLVSFGAKGCKNEIEIAKNADVIITMVPTSKHVSDVYTLILPYLDESKICIDMSTIEPDVSVSVAKMVSTKGARFADCPVVRSKAAAIDATLGILVGCDAELFETIKPILQYMGSNIIYMGENGKGISAKICHNTLVAQIQNAVNETAILAEKLGISIDNFARTVKSGGAQNSYMEAQKECIKNEDWTTAFSMENMDKDVNICYRLSKELNFSMPGMENAKRILDEGVKRGWAKEDYRKTYLIVKENMK